MRLRNDALLAVVLALLSAGLVSLGAWFTLTRRDTCEALLGRCGDVGGGTITVLIVVASGWLLAYAFDQAEAAFVLFRQRSRRDSGVGD